MRCHRTRTLYDEYSGGLLPLATVARIEEHLAGCPPCRDYFEQHDQIARALRQSTAAGQPSPEYFQNLNARVLAELDKPVSRGRQALEKAAIQPVTRLSRPLWWSAGLAAAALLALGLFPLVSNDIDQGSHPFTPGPAFAKISPTQPAGEPIVVARR